jgi:hypothetical protein
VKVEKKEHGGNRGGITENNKKDLNLKYQQVCQVLLDQTLELRARMLGQIKRARPYYILPNKKYILNIKIEKRLKQMDRKEYKLCKQ